jgi:FkbM family methyltransferase
MGILRNLIGDFRRRGAPAPEYKMSYAASGEDMIADFVFRGLNIQSPTYLDVGAHHPTYLSNTYFFYQKGSRGVCVEPDPTLFPAIASARAGDVCLNVGVGVGAEDEADFYVMTTRTLNTFSREEAERYQSYGNQRIEEVIRMPLVPINEIIGRRFAACPNFVSLDVEGLDLDIIRSFDFDRFRPEVFCVETITYTEDKTETKITEIIDHMISKGYFPYGDTYVNTIFVAREAWLNR